jgi:hypothetical protein
MVCKVVSYFQRRTWTKMGRESSVGIALSYGQDDWGSRVRFPAGAGNFSLHHRVQNGSGAHQASHPVGIRGSFPGGKAAGAWSWPLHLVSRSKNAWSYTFTPQYAFMAWYLVKHRDNFTFTFTWTKRRRSANYLDLGRMKHVKTFGLTFHLLLQCWSPLKHSIAADSAFTSSL